MCFCCPCCISINYKKISGQKKRELWIPVYSSPWLKRPICNFDLLQFSHVVLKIQPLPVAEELRNNVRWELMSKNWKTEQVMVDQFDAIMVCCGSVLYNWLDHLFLFVVGHLLFKLIRSTESKVKTEFRSQPSLRIAFYARYGTENTSFTCLLTQYLSGSALALHDFFSISANWMSSFNNADEWANVTCERNF